MAEASSGVWWLFAALVLVAILLTAYARYRYLKDERMGASLLKDYPYSQSYVLQDGRHIPPPRGKRVVDAWDLIGQKADQMFNEEIDG